VSLATGIDREVLSRGTRLGIHLDGVKDERLKVASSAIIGEVGRIEAACSTWLASSSLQ
jgi:hypothetical protein